MYGCWSAVCSIDSLSGDDVEQRSPGGLEPRASPVHDSLLSLLIWTCGATSIDNFSQVLLTQLLLPLNSICSTTYTTPVPGVRMILLHIAKQQATPPSSAVVFSKMGKIRSCHQDFLSARRQPSKSRRCL